VVEDSRPTANDDDVEASEDAGPSVKSTGEKKEKVSPTLFIFCEQRLMYRKQQ
jgi:hypothetical protein